MKRILTRESYLRELNLKYYNKYTGVEPINEEAPFANDAPWGDTLIGRLINSFARKGKIAFNKRRISGLVSRFKSIFDEMLETGNIEISNEDIRFLKISNLLGELERQVRDEEDVDILILTTTDLIDLVNSYEFEFQEEMLESLNDFLEYLKGLKKGDPGDSSTDTESDTDTSNPSEIFYKQSKLFLQSVLDLHMMIKQNVVRFSGTQSSNANVGTNFDISKFNEIKSKYEKAQQKDKLSLLKQLVQMCNNGLNIFKAKKDTANINLFTKYLNEYSRLLKKLSIQVGKEYFYTNKSGEKKKVKVVSLTHDTEVGKDKNWLTQDDVKKTTLAKDTISVIYKDKNGKYTSGSPGMAVNFDGLSPVKESLLLEGEANITQVETHSKNAWKKVVNAYNQSKVSSFVPQIEELLKISIKDGKDKFLQSKKDIISICKQTVLNKATVGKPISFDDLIKEAVNVNDISKSISLFGRILLSYKEDMGLTGGYGSAISPLKSFINSFTELEKTLPKIKSESNKEEVRESISKYDNFILLREKNEYSSQITEKFDEIFTEDIQKYFTINEEKVSDFNDRVKKRESMVFTDADPIIEIVRLFNRAWRIHTPGVIPSGRTGGKVSNSVFREYEDLGDRGGTPDAPGSGPYRNIELYEAWFEAVQDILSDTKYRPIFSDEVVFKFKNIETGEDGDSIPKAGKILLKFINELLSDTKMYKEGAMNKFIQEYFDLDSKKVPKTYPGFSNDGENNSETSSGIKTTEVVFKKLEQVRSLDYSAANNLWKLFTERNKDDFKNLAFRLKTKNGDKIISYYCVYQQTSENYPIIIFRSDSFPFDLTKASSRDISRNIERSRPTYLASLPKSGGFLKNNNKSLFRYVDLEDPGESKVNNSSGDNRVEFEIQEIEILCIKESGEPYLDLDNYLSILKTGITRGYNAALNTIKKY
jgi:hypothetical protein